MNGFSVVIADKHVVFTMEIEQMLRSNGFESLSVKTIQKKAKLKRELSNGKPDVLIIGDFYEDQETVLKSGLDSLLLNIVNSESKILIINVSNSRLSEIPNKQNPVFSLEKPVDSQNIHQAVSHWYQHRDRAPKV